MDGAYRHRTHDRTVALPLLGALILSCVTNSSASFDPITSVSLTSAAAEQHIASLVHDWFDALEAGSVESRTLGRFMAEPSFDLSLIGGSVRNLSELDTWCAHLHSTHYELAYQIGLVDVETVGQDLHRARFQLDRRSVDDHGVPHIARREHAWLVRVVPGEAPVILRIDERPLLAFSGTGPQIVCY